MLGAMAKKEGLTFVETLTGFKWMANVAFELESLTGKDIFRSSLCIYNIHRRGAAQRAKFSEKVHKPSPGVNVINFELNVFNASIWVPWSPSDPKISRNALRDRSIQNHKICVKSCMFAPILL